MQDDRTEIEVLNRYAEQILAKDPKEAKSMHFASRFGASQYVQILRDIEKKSVGPRILDWGTGFGQNTLLLGRAGFEVHSFDVRDRYRKYFDLAIDPESLRFTLGPDGTALPYEDGFFDNVLSCGVLEHVPDEKGSLAEVRRILRPGGAFILYHLPNRLSYTEYKNRKTGGYFHDRTYRRGEVRSVLEAGGFEVLSVSRFHFLPRVYVENRPALRRFVDRHYNGFNRLDALLEKTPPFSLFSTAWQALARRPGRGAS